MDLGGVRLFQAEKQNSKVQRQECTCGFQEMATTLVGWNGVSRGALRFCQAVTTIGTKELRIRVGGGGGNALERQEMIVKGRITGKDLGRDIVTGHTQLGAGGGQGR